MKPFFLQFLGILIDIAMDCLAHLIFRIFRAITSNKAELRIKIYLSESLYRSIILNICKHLIKRKIGFSSFLQNKANEIVTLNPGACHLTCKNFLPDLGIAHNGS